MSMAYTLAEMKEMSYTQRIQEIAMQVTPHDLAKCFLKEYNDANALRERVLELEHQLFLEETRALQLEAEKEAANYAKIKL